MSIFPSLTLVLSAGFVLVYLDKMLTLAVAIAKVLP